MDWGIISFILNHLYHGDLVNELTKELFRELLLEIIDICKKFLENLSSPDKKNTEEIQSRFQGIKNKFNTLFGSKKTEEKKELEEEKKEIEESIQILTLQD